VKIEFDSGKRIKKKNIISAIIEKGGITMKVLVVYHSLYGHVLQLAHAVSEGAGNVGGVDASMRRVDEFEEIVREKAETDKYFRTTWDKQKDIPVCTLEDLREADGIVIGSPTRYGNMTAQMKKLIDATVQLWLEGSMEGKPVGVFTSTATTHGGQETTLLTMMVPLLHLGMIIVGVPYSTPGMLHTEGRGGTPYGATTIAGQQNELRPSSEDLEIAKALGMRVAEAAKKLRG
jgi:NAD(P)H dehydrogenase (quinone)